MSTAHTAILDVDGTLLPGALGVDLLRALVAQNVCRSSDAQRVFAVLADFQRGRLDFSTMTTRAYEAYASALAGCEVERVEAIAELVWAEARPRMFEFVPALLERLRAHGFVPMLISGSPIEMVALVARELGIELAHGAVFGRADGRYTGRVDLSSGRIGEKPRIFTNTVGDRFALAHSFALGDSLTDAALFEQVGWPLAFEPSDALAELARARGWTVAGRDDVLARLDELLTQNPHENPRTPDTRARATATEQAC